MQDVKRWHIREVPMTNNEREAVAHWSVLRRDAKRWKLLVRSLCGLGPGKTVLERYPPVELRIVVTRSQRQDQEDNFPGSLKPILDALVRWGWLYDDSSKWLVLETEEIGRRDKSLHGVEIEWQLPESSK